MISYSVEYQSRRTVSIRITDRGTVLVRAPKGMPRADIERFVGRAQVWIERKQAERAARRAVSVSYCYGAVLYHGDRIPVERDAVRRTKLKDGILHIAASADPRVAVRDWLTRRAAEELPERVLCVARKYGTRSSEVLLTSARTQWGNCNGRFVRLSKYLICIPAELADYVILHELAHLEHLDHSPAFWNYVLSRMPNARALKHALKNYVWLLDIYRDGYEL